MSLEQRLSPAIGLVLIAAAIFTTLSLTSYHPGDAGHAPSAGPIFNYGGKVGAWLSLSLFLFLGQGAYAIPLLLVVEGMARILSRQAPRRPFWFPLIHEILILMALSPLLSLRRGTPARALGWQLEKVGWGGYWGRVASSFSLKYLGLIGTRIVLITVLVVSALLLMEMKPLLWTIALGRRTLAFLFSLLPSRRRVRVSRFSPRQVPEGPAPADRRRDGEERRRERLELARKQEEVRKKSRELEELKARDLEERKARRRKEEEAARERVLREQEAERERARQEEERLREKRRLEKQRQKELERERKRVPRSPPHPVSPRPEAAVPPAAAGEFTLPTAELLMMPPPLGEREIKDDIEVNSRILESTLSDFGIEAKVVGAERGPAITRYELQPAPGVKVQKIKALDSDIALAMKATSVRILAPIPGKAAIGIEVPNSSTALVYMREMIESPEYRSRKALLPLALGKDISGTSIIADLTDMPHLLIAGATGSGKTVCMNSVIISLLYARTPDELKLILVDPKKVEMSAYSRLPHLLCPAVTDPVKTSMALAWLVKEMEKRYDLFARAGSRNIEGYNQVPKPLPAEGEEKLPDRLPYIVLMIDELADLMLTAQTEIENAIARLAHLSRAVGIHMILATQRPSVDVITGIIKANFPARLSFKVAAKVDSRTVLDGSGADKLLGNGDLLFLPPGSSRMIRAQGTLCHDAEIEAVVGFVVRQREPSFQPEIFQKGGGGKISLGGGEDILLEAAIEVIKQTGQASVSVLQRKLKIGYSRSARIIDILEEKGVVGPYQGSKAREILIETYAGGETDETEETDESG